MNNRKKNQKGGSISKDLKIIESSPYVLNNSKYPVNPKKTNTDYYSHVSPPVQTFDDYICIKKSVIRDLKELIKILN